MATEIGRNGGHVRNRRLADARVRLSNRGAGVADEDFGTFEDDTGD